MALEHKRIAERIKEARLSAGLKQREMADLLDVIQRTYQNYESKENPRIPWDRMNDIGRITGKKVEWLLHGETPDLMGSLNGDASALADQIISEFKAALSPIEQRLDAIEKRLATTEKELVEVVAEARRRAQDRKRAAQARRAKKRTGS